jgi:AhpD family alkylhydroperoxidase
VNELRFDDRVAVVTGAGRGIGRAYAKLLAERGAAVVVNDLGAEVDGSGASAGPADEVVAEIRAAGGVAIADTHSVADAEGVAGLIEKATSEFGRVDVVVHNAGFNLGELDPIFDVHVRAAWLLADAVWPGMVAQGYGRLVLTTSSAGLYGDGTGPGPNPKQAYATAKAAVIGLTRALAVRGRPAGIRVNAVSPSAFTRLVGLNRNIINTRPDAPLPDAAIEFSRANSPTELVAAGALFMMHEDCPVTGRIYNIGTGRVGEVFVGVTRGYVSPSGELTPEDVLAHFDEISDLSEFNVPEDIGAHGTWVRRILADRAHRADRSASALHQELMRAPEVARAQRSLRESVMGGLDGRTAELIILRHAAVTGNEYCWAQHVAPAQDAGLTALELDAVRTGELPRLGDVDRLIVDFVDSALAGRESPALRAALAERFGPGAVVSIVMLVGYYSMIGSARSALGVGLD